MLSVRMVFMDAGARVRAHGCRDCCRRSSVQREWRDVPCGAG